MDNRLFQAAAEANPALPKDPVAQTQNIPLSDGAFDWDDEFIVEIKEFTVLKPGDYDFTVKSVERSTFPGSKREGGIGACNTLVLNLDVTDGVNHATIRHNLYLTERCKSLINQFLVSVGLRNRGDKVSLSQCVGNIPGSHGRCKVRNRSWTGNDGKTRESNEIEQFYVPVGADHA